jgi:hypothetical protein
MDPMEPIDQAGGAPQPLPLQLELPSEKRAPAPTEQEARRPRRRAGGGGLRWLVRIATVLAALAVLAAAAVVWLLPWYVKERCIAEAAAHGVVLEVGSVSIAANGFQLHDAVATSAALPGASAKAAEVDVVTVGLHPDVMTVRRAELTLAGPWSTMDAALSSWRASSSGGQGGGWTPRAVVLDESRLVWPAPFAENARIEASNVHFDGTWGSATAPVHAGSDNVVVGVPGGKLGPWRVDADRSAGAWRVRVALDPGVPDTSTLLVVRDAAGATTVDAEVPRSPLSRLGIPPALLGLKGNIQADLDAHYVPMGPQRAEVTAKGGVYGIEAGLPVPLDVSWALSASGAPASGLDVQKSRLGAGPLVGELTGTVKPFDDGFRVDLAWKAGPVPCTAFDKPLAEGDPFDIAYQLRQLAGAAGLVKGDVSASGRLTFDSRDLGASRVEFLPAVGCRVSLFGG